MINSSERSSVDGEERLIRFWEHRLKPALQAMHTLIEYEGFHDIRSVVTRIDLVMSKQNLNDVLLMETLNKQRKSPPQVANQLPNALQFLYSLATFMAEEAGAENFVFGHLYQQYWVPVISKLPYEPSAQADQLEKLFADVPLPGELGSPELARDYDWGNYGKVQQERLVGMMNHSESLAVTA